jgi:hypothetical protein
MKIKGKHYKILNKQNKNYYQFKIKLKIMPTEITNSILSL